jgi:hypothetical protein
MVAASWWERIRSLDWLALFIASWVVPFILDYAVGLTYFTSLTFWLSPTLLLLPRFLEFTDGGGRRRSAMWLTTGAIVGLGVLLDCVFGRRILQFDESPNATYIGWLSLPALGVHVPYEEFLFYAMTPPAVLLIYGWASEYWIALYTPRHDSQAMPPSLVGVSLRGLLVAALMMAIGIVVFRRNPEGAGLLPAYYTFLVALAFLPAVFLFSRVQQYVNWRAFGVTALYLLVTSMAWEATLALPRHWWGYKPSAMLGIWVTAWTQDPTWPFPLEAALVWVASPFAIVLTYEFVKLWKYRADPSKPTYVHPTLR